MHSIRGNIDEAAIITSDLDFFPLFEALLQTKTRSTLMYQLGRTSTELITTADNSVPLTLWSVAEWGDPKFGGLIGGLGVNNKHIESSELIRRGHLQDREFKLYRYSERTTPHYYVMEGMENRSTGRQLECFAIA